jgi:hypothetical protein
MTYVKVASASDTAPGSTANSSRPARSRSRIPASAGYRVAPGFSAPGQLANLLRICECERPGQWCLGAGLEELNVPAGPVEERHVDPMARTIVARHADGVGE